MAATSVRSPKWVSHSQVDLVFLQALLKSPSVFLALRCLIQILGFFLECFKGFQRESRFPHHTTTCIFLSHSYLAWSGVSGESWETREVGAAGLILSEQPRTHPFSQSSEASRCVTGRCTRTCTQGGVKGYGKQCQVPPEARGGGRKVSDGDARGLRGTQGSKNTVTDGSETRKTQGQRW